MAKIINGTVEHQSDALDGLTVSEAIEEYSDILQIADGSRTSIDGEEVGGSRILHSGDVLVFDQPTGSKGRRVVVKVA